MTSVSLLLFLRSLWICWFDSYIESCEWRRSLISLINLHVFTQHSASCPSWIGTLWAVLTPGVDQEQDYRSDCCNFKLPLNIYCWECLKKKNILVFWSWKHFPAWPPISSKGSSTQVLTQFTFDTKPNIDSTCASFRILMTWFYYSNKNKLP